MTDAPTTRRTRWAAAAGVLGAVTAFAALAGAGAGPASSRLDLASSSREDVSGNCDEAEHANDPACGGTGTVDDSTSTTVADSTSTTLDDSTSTTVVNPGPADEIRTIDANGAGIVIVAVEGGSLRLVAATPSAGWQVEIENGAGREIEVDFRSGSKRVQVNVELEDGQVRERVRSRDDAADDSSGSSSGSGDDSSGDDDSSDDDHSGSGHGGDDDSDDDDSDDSDDSDHSGSGHGGDDDSSDDDHGGHGSDD